MNKKQYKVRIENGQIIPLEPIDLESKKEGIIIFFDDDFSTTKSLLKFANTWVGNDLEECLEEVYRTRGKAEF